MRQQVKQLQTANRPNQSSIHLQKTRHVYLNLCLQPLAKRLYWRFHLTFQTFVSSNCCSPVTSSTKWNPTNKQIYFLINYVGVVGVQEWHFSKTAPFCIIHTQPLELRRPGRRDVAEHHLNENTHQQLHLTAPFSSLLCRTRKLCTFSPSHHTSQNVHCPENNFSSHFGAFVSGNQFFFSSWWSRVWAWKFDLL